MPRLTVRDLVMPVATVVILTAVLGLILFGTLAIPALALAAAAIVGGVALLLWSSARRRSV